MREVLRLSGIAAGLVLALAVAGVPVAANAQAQAPPYVAQFGNVGKAVCGAGDVPETGLQGQVPAALRQSGFKGFRCNLQLMSQYAGQGAIWVGNWYGHCFYMSTASNANETNKGVAVVDVSDPSNAKFTGSLSTPGMLNTWEGLRASSNGLLMAQQTANTPGLNGQWFDVYDVSKDCAHPSLMASIDLGEPNAGHEGAVSPDGKTYYDMTTQSPDPNLAFVAIDVSKPNQPKVLLKWHLPFPEPRVHIHGMGISSDGNIGYGIIASVAPNNNTNGLVVLDLSQIQQRKPNPQVRVISTLPWRDNSVGQMAQEFHQNGRTFIVAVDEGGSGSYKGTAPNGPGVFTPGFLWPSTCDGYDPFAFGRIVDVTDPRVPTQISQLRIEVQDPKNCSQIINDAPQGTIFGYNAHYCGVDNTVNPTAVACGYFESGVRVFDIRDPYHPKEIAYYNPPAKPENSGLAQAGAFDSDPPVDWASSWSRFYHAPDGSWELWIQTQENGVQILKFTNGVYPLKAAGAPPVAAATAGGGPGPVGWIALAGLILELVALGGLVLRRRTAPA